MAKIQKQMQDFYDQIKLGQFKENATLREKRDIIRNRLEERLPDAFADHGEECPAFYFRDQGSYEYGTGINPENCDYDIDQGLFFEVSADDYPDPVILKERVYEALVGHTDDVCIRRSCVTVYYHCDGEPIYHVDIAIYSDATYNWDNQTRIAKGKQFSDEEFRVWEISDPVGLAELLEARFSGNDRAQFRRVICDLKKWKDGQFSPDGHEAPLGIALTVAAYYNFQPSYSDIVSGKADDLTALANLVHIILTHFSPVWDSEEQRYVNRLSIPLPVEPRNDLFEKMTNRQMENFQAKLTEFRDCLDAAIATVDPTEACELLQRVFSKDFPVPERPATAKQLPPAVVSSSHSA